MAISIYVHCNISRVNEIDSWRKWLGILGWKHLIKFIGELVKLGRGQCKSYSSTEKSEKRNYFRKCEKGRRHRIAFKLTYLFE